MEKKKKNLGLNSDDVLERLQKYGPNQIDRQKSLSWTKLIFDQLKSPLIYILIFAGLVTLFLKEYTDSVVIFAAVLVNTILGLYQEAKAENSLLALRNLIVSHSWVMRDGKEKKIESKDIVPGDVVILKTGEKVPADGILLDAVVLHVDEAMLTGESLPVEKNADQEGAEENQVYMGTIVVSGRGRMLVSQTGMETKMGQIALGLKETIEEETPLRQQIGKLSRMLAIVVLLICFFILIDGLLSGIGFAEIFSLSAAIAVAAIPEGLVISVTTILVLGIQKLLASKVLVRKLLAAETLGSVSCICADKTGTLTEGKMKVSKWEVVDEKLLVQASLLCNNLINPIETAMYHWAEEQLEKKDGLLKEELLDKKRLDEIPFSSEKKYIAVMYEDYTFVSGAPERILSLSKIFPKERKEWEKKLNSYSGSGLRVVAFAYSKNSEKERSLKNQIDSRQLTWLGLQAYEDPVRKNVSTALKLCQKAGIKIKVITGDYCGTALAVLNQLQIGNGELKPENIMEGEILERIPQDQLAQEIEKIVLFCRTTPEQKIKIVQALQKRGEVVAMMGDGVNDALALKKSDIGVVVGEASEVAKETADMVLLDSNFNTIVQAVGLGRGIFENIKKVVLFLLSGSFTELILVGGSLLIGLPAPLLAVQILWVNLVEDGLPGIALAFEPEEDGLLDKPPRNKNKPIIDKEMRIIILVIGFVTDLGLLGLFIVLYKLGHDMVLVRTIIFIGLGIDSLFYIFSCKSLHKNIWQIPIFNNMMLNLSVVIGFLMLFGAVYLPFMRILLKTAILPLWAFALLIAFGLVKLAIIEGVKSFFRE